MSPKIPHIIPLTPTVMHYPWGRAGARSLVAQLSKERDALRPCAELWVGAHPKAPSLAQLPDRTVALDVLLRDHGKELLGDELFSKYGGALPFLLKILSIEKPLSIQAHPDRALAKALHHRDPANYPDENHKPEMAIALSPVELLFGFYSEAEMEQVLLQYPEITAVVAATGGAPDGSSRNLASTTYKALLSAPRLVLKEQAERLQRRLVAQASRSRVEALFLKLLDEYPPGDVGLLCLFVLRYTVLQPKEVIFILPNTPHAYLSGELVECMASSDNVVRAGLTIKHCDVPTLLEMSDFQVREPSYIAGVKSKNGGQIFTPPTEEFFLEELRAANAEFYFDSNSAPRVLLCLSGAATITDQNGVDSINLGAGDAAFVSFQCQGASVRITGAHMVLASVA